MTSGEPQWRRCLFSSFCQRIHELTGDAQKRATGASTVCGRSSGTFGRGWDQAEGIRKRWKEVESRTSHSISQLVVGTLYRKALKFSRQPKLGNSICQLCFDEPSKSAKDLRERVFRPLQNDGEEQWTFQSAFETEPFVCLVQLWEANFLWRLRTSFYPKWAKPTGTCWYYLLNCFEMRLDWTWQDCSGELLASKQKQKEAKLVTSTPALMDGGSHDGVCGKSKGSNRDPFSNIGMWFQGLNSCCQQICDFLRRRCKAMSALKEADAAVGSYEVTLKVGFGHGRPLCWLLVWPGSNGSARGEAEGFGDLRGEHCQRFHRSQGHYKNWGRVENGQCLPTLPVLRDTLAIAVWLLGSHVK